MYLYIRVLYAFAMFVILFEKIHTNIITNPVIEVSEGKLKGKVVKSVNGVDFYAFIGVPYAKPPLDKLRFSVTESPDSWLGTRDATQGCNICAQFDKGTSEIIGNEDCLFLNILTPKLPSDSSASLPVMVFIHGGGFIQDDDTNKRFVASDSLVEKDVVAVSINYRLGIVGFLSLDRKEASGNMGLRDQVQALKWVQENISKFNGNPKNVTIFGVSAGAASVEYLLISPLAKGLFHKAISQSGSSILPWALNKNVKELAFKVPIEKITDEDELYRYLRDLPIKDLIELSRATIQAEEHKAGLYFGFTPTIEKPDGSWEPFLATSPNVLLKKGNFTKVPYMAGFCSREGLLMKHYDTKRLEKLASEKNFYDYLPFAINDDAKQIMDNYLRATYLDSEKDNTEAEDFTIDFFTDVDFLGGIYFAISNIAKNNSPVYFYEFSYDGGYNVMKIKYNITDSGACHEDDIGYILDTHLDVLDFTETDQLVKERMTTMWTNFAKSGDPTPVIDELISTKWEPVSEAGLVYLNIGDTLQMRSNLLPRRMKLFMDFYDKMN